MEFQVKDCRVQVSFYFLALLTFSLLADRTGVAGVGLIAALLHESGHLFAMCWFHMPPQAVKIHLFGVDMELGSLQRSYQQDIVISLAGPIMNAICFLFFGWMATLLQHPYPFALSISNLLLFLFHSLPINSLDGGQVVYAILCRRVGAVQASKTVLVISIVALLPIAIAGFWILLKSRYNFTLLFVAAYLAALLVGKKTYC